VKLLGSSVVTTTEDSDQLVFTFERQAGWVELLVPPIIVVGCALLSWQDRAWWLLALCVVGMVMFASKWSREGSGKLTVSGYGFVVIPDFKRFPNRTIRYQPQVVQRLKFFAGIDENDPFGLYLNEDCIVPEISEEQANEIAYRIFAKFPDIGGPDTRRASILHGDDSGITSLGLIR
jgi:hypothetical protein